MNRSTTIILLFVLLLAATYPATAQEGGSRLPITLQNAAQVVELARLDHDTPLDALVWSAGGTWLAVAGAPGIWLYDTADLDATPRLLASPADAVTAVAFSPDGVLLAAGSADGALWLWDVITGEVVRTLAGYTGRVESLAFSPDGMQLVSGGPYGDGAVRLWDVLTGDLLAMVPAVTAAYGVAFSPDGETVAFAASSEVERWTVDAPLVSSQNPAALPAHLTGAHCVAYSPEGELLAAGGTKYHPALGTVGMLHVWDAGTGKLLMVFQRPKRGVIAVTFSPDGTLIASGDAYGTVRLWDAHSTRDESLAALEGHRSRVPAVAFHPDGTFLASADYNGTVRLWGVAATE